MALLFNVNASLSTSFSSFLVCSFLIVSLYFLIGFSIHDCDSPVELDHVCQTRNAASGDLVMNRHFHHKCNMTNGLI